MYTKLVSLLLVVTFIHIGSAQETNKLKRWRDAIQKKKEKKKEKNKSQDEKAATNTNVKVWEVKDDSDTKIYESDGYTAAFRPAHTRNPNEFIALVSTRKQGSRFSLDDLNFEYRGACGPQLMVKAVSVMYTNQKFQKYFETGNFKDAPIEGLLNAIVKGLRDQCDALESVRFTTGPIYFPRKDGEQKVVTLNANMSKANGWKLEEGFGTSLEGLEIKLRIPPGISSQLAVSYDGTCNTTQKLKIEPVFSNNTERYAYQKEKTLAGYEDVAKRAVKQYLLECPTVEEIEFSLDYLPEPIFVREGKEGVIRASKKDNWVIDTSEFGYYRAEGPQINDYEDVLTLLEKKEFPFIDRYADFFKLFYEDFMDVYGTVCTNNLKNPTKISIHAFESRYNSEGFKISETELGPPQVLHIETAYLKRYQRFSHYNKATVLYNVFKGFFNGSHQGGTDAILFRIRGQQYIKKYINNNCNGEELKSVYNYMQELAAKVK